MKNCYYLFFLENKFSIHQQTQRRIFRQLMCKNYGLARVVDIVFVMLVINKQGIFLCYIGTFSSTHSLPLVYVSFNRWSTCYSGRRIVVIRQRHCTVAVRQRGQWRAGRACRMVIIWQGAIFAAKKNRGVHFCKYKTKRCKYKTKRCHFGQRFNKEVQHIYIYVTCDVVSNKHDIKHIY